MIDRQFSHTKHWSGFYRRTYGCGWFCSYIYIACVDPEPKMNLMMFRNLSPSPKVNSKWVKDLNLKLETLCLLEESMESLPEHFLNRTLAAQKNDKWKWMELKYLYSKGNCLQRGKTAYRMGESQSALSQQVLVCRKLWYLEYIKICKN